MIAYKQIELQKFYFNEHLTHSCVGMPKAFRPYRLVFIDSSLMPSLGVKLPKDGINELSKDGFDCIALKVIFEGPKGQ